MAFTADNYSNPGVEYDYSALNSLLAARMADGMDESNAADLINDAMTERDDGSLYVGETKVGQVQYIEETTMKTIATGLSTKGRRALAQFLADNLNDAALAALVAEFERDIVFGRNGDLRGDLEIEAHHSGTKRPETTWFEGDEIVTEEVEDED